MVSSWAGFYHPSRPSAIGYCFFSSFKTLLTRMEDSFPPSGQDPESLKLAGIQVITAGLIRGVTRPLKHSASMLVPHHRHRRDRLFCSSQHAAPGPPEKCH